jgi:hypothetical protein
MYAGGEGVPVNNAEAHNRMSLLILAGPSENRLILLAEIAAGLTSNEAVAPDQMAVAFVPLPSRIIR